jgi:hypothetical protein
MGRCGIDLNQTRWQIAQLNGNYERSGFECHAAIIALIATNSQSLGIH